MIDLPRHIADLCGLLMEPVTTLPKTERPAVAVNPIQFVSNDDGTMTLTYFGKVVGWVNKTKLDRRNEMAFRAMSVHGNVRMCWSLSMAKDWLLEQHH